MKFELHPFDTDHHAASVSINNMTLKWSNPSSSDHIILRDKYDSYIQFDETIVDKLADINFNDLLQGIEIQLDHNLYINFLRKQAVNIKSFTVKVSPASYAVFSCEYNVEADICKVYVPNDACNYQCSVESKVEVLIKKDIPEKKGLFAKLQKQSEVKEYYLVRIPQIPGYVDGELYYSFENCKYRYPVTKRMLGKEIPIPSYRSQRPQISGTSGNGYKIETR